MSSRAQGTFEIQLNALALSEAAGLTGLKRLSLDKQFSGDLAAVSQGEMLSFRSEVPGSAGYVAMETVRGSLHGRQGSFVLQHNAKMTRGEPVQAISVVPDSGTGQLAGIVGSMVIVIVDGQHSYRFEYELPEASR